MRLGRRVDVRVVLPPVPRLLVRSVGVARHAAPLGRRAAPAAAAAVAAGRVADVEDLRAEPPDGGRDLVPGALLLLLRHLLCPE